MALIHCDSFDDRAIASIGDRYIASGGDFNYNVSAGSAIGAGRTGNALVLSTGILDDFDRITYAFSSRQSVYVGVAWGNPGLSTALCSIRYNGTPQIYAQLNSDNTISVIRFDNGSPQVTLATSSQQVSSGFFYVELYGKIDSSDGAYELRVNGSRWLSGSGINTSSTGDALANQVRLTFNHSGTDGQTANVDDFYISDEDTDDGNASIIGFAGPVKIVCRNPNGAGASSEWTPLSGANHTNVDETTGKDDDTSYVASLTEGAVDLYAHQALEVINPTIVAVAVHQWAKKMDGTSRTIAPVAYVGGVEYPGDEDALGISYGHVFHAFEKNPATGAAWTRAQVSSAQFGAMLGS